MTLSRTRLVAGITAAALPLAFLAGCGEDEPQPRFEDPTSESPSASETATPDEPTKPTPPTAMEGDDVAGAKAFVEYYFEVWDYAVASGNVRALRRLAFPSCVACKAVTDALQKSNTNGGTITGGAHTVQQVQFNQPSSSSGTRIFLGNARVLSTKQVIEGSGVKGLDGVYQPDTVKLFLTVAKDGNRWGVSEWRAS